MDLIKHLSARVETQQTQKLQDLSSSAIESGEDRLDFSSRGAIEGKSNGASDLDGDDFERLVFGRGKGNSPAGNSKDPWLTDDTSSSKPSLVTAHLTNSFPNNTKGSSAFVWSSANNASHQTSTFRTVTPDLGAFAALEPASSNRKDQPKQLNSSQGGLGTIGILQPQSRMGEPSHSSQTSSPNYNPQSWGVRNVSPVAAGGPPGVGGTANSMATLFLAPQVSRSQSASNNFSIPPPPPSNNVNHTPSIPWNNTQSSGGHISAFSNPSSTTNSSRKSGLDAYESLL